MARLLGEERAAAIIGFHSFTGCDVTGKFAGRNLLRQYDKLAALANLGASENQMDDNDLRNLKRFTFFLYDSTKIVNIKDLRWYLYLRKKSILACTEICGCFDHDCGNPYNISTNGDTYIRDEEEYDVFDI